MNKRKLLAALNGLPNMWSGAFAVCGVMFMAGVIFGSFLSEPFCKSGAASDFVGAYLSGAKGVSVNDGLFSLMISCGKYHIVVFLLGFSMLGVITVPVLSMIRGFSIAFTISVFVRLFSTNGFLAGLMLVGVESAVSVPLFLFLAAQSLSASISLGRIGMGLPHSAAPGVYSRSYFLRFFAAIIFLLLISAGERPLIVWGLLKLSACF